MKYLLTIILIFISAHSYAGSGGGKVLSIYAHEKGDGEGVIIFRTEINTNKAACSTSNAGREWAFMANTDQGKAMYSLLLSAAVSRSNISVNGNGDCNAWGDRERPKFIQVSY